MRTMFHYLIIMFLIMLFIFRLVVVFTATMGIEFVVKPINVEYEITLLLVMVISIILISKNKMIGTIALVAASVAYYGPTLLKDMTSIAEGVTITTEMAIQIIMSVISLIVPVFAFFIVAFAKEQEKRPVDKETDFFYKNEAYDRELDERADKNNYRIM